MDLPCGMKYSFLLHSSPLEQRGGMGGRQEGSHLVRACCCPELAPQPRGTPHYLVGTQRELFRAPPGFLQLLLLVPFPVPASLADLSTTVTSDIPFLSQAVLLGRALTGSRSASPHVLAPLSEVIPPTALCCPCLPCHNLLNSHAFCRKCMSPSLSFTTASHKV